jgi:hypothetical protein
MLKELLDKIFGKQPESNPVEHVVAGQMPAEQLEKLIRDAIRTNDIELNCSSTFDLIDEYIDRLAQGEDAATAMPLVSQHLELCPECEEEYRMLLRVMESLSNEGGPA